VSRCNSTKSSTIIRITAIALTACLAAGCGSNLPQTVRVTGRVTFDGKAPQSPGTIYFLPIEAGEGFPSRPATADYGIDGIYKTTTFEPGDGLMPGKYVMHVESWATPPGMDGTPGKSLVPKKYQAADTSGLKLDVTPDMKAQELNIDLASK
jgi:hypothetical protein